MSRKEIRVEGLAEPISHFTDGVLAGDLLFVSGIVAVDGEGRLVGRDDVVAQARQVFENMRAVLAAVGCGFEDIVKVTIGRRSTRCGRRCSALPVPLRRSWRSRASPLRARRSKSRRWPHCAPEARYRPWKRGGRFSTKASTPSRKSCVVRR